MGTKTVVHTDVHEAVVVLGKELVLKRDFKKVVLKGMFTYIDPAFFSLFAEAYPASPRTKLWRYGVKKGMHSCGIMDTIEELRGKCMIDLVHLHNLLVQDYTHAIEPLPFEKKIIFFVEGQDGVVRIIFIIKNAKGYVLHVSKPDSVNIHNPGSVVMYRKPIQTDTC